MTTAKAASDYIKAGFSPIPIPHRKKYPESDAWQHLRIGLDDIPKYFNGSPQNIGILLGDQYGTADMDLDCAEAIDAAVELAPETGMVFGRESKRRSHHFYRCDPSVPSRKYVDPIDKKVILELRCQTKDGSIGLQTVVPPSVHESGEPIEFEPECTHIPANIDAQTLEQAASRIATTALLIKHWPKEGSRHEAFLALAGALANNGWSEDSAVQFHRAIYSVIWKSLADLNAADLEVSSTFDKCRAGGNVTGIPRLKELIDHQVVNAVCEWLHIDGTADVSWPEPILLADGQADPLPVDVLPGTLGNYVQALSRFTETPAELPTLAVLGVMSAVAAGKVEVEAEPGYREPVNLYACPILEPGNRKTEVIKRVTAPLAAYERREHERLAPEIARVKSELKTKQLAIDKLRKSTEFKDEATIKQIADLEQGLPVVPRVPTLFTSDATAERLEVLLSDHDGRMALISDEGGAFDVMAGRYSSTPNLDVFLKGHSQGSLRVHRMQRTTAIDRPHLTIVLSPQPGVLSDLRDKRFMHNRGLFARFLFAMPPSPIGHRSLEPREMPPQTIAAYESLVSQILQWKPDTPVILTLSKKAYRDWKDFQRGVEMQMAEGGRLCRLRDWGSKLPGAALRIAGLLHVANDSKVLPVLRGEIEESEIGIALKICTTLISHAIAVFEMVRQDPIISKAKRIFRWLLTRKTEPVLTKKMCFDGLHPHVFEKMDEMELSLKVLIDHYLIRIEKQSASGKRGGRPTERIELNPALKELL